MATHDKQGFRAVPARSLTEELLLAQRLLEGMAKHAKDPDYPSGLDVFGLSAERDRAAQAATDASATKLTARKAAANAAATRTQFGVTLERMQALLESSYGKRNPILFDYGFRPYAPPQRARKSPADKAGARGKRGHGTAAGSATAGAGSGGAEASGSAGSSGSAGAPSSAASGAAGGGVSGGR